MCPLSRYCQERVIQTRILTEHGSGRLHYKAFNPEVIARGEEMFEMRRYTQTGMEKAPGMLTVGPISRDDGPSR